MRVSDFPEIEKLSIPEKILLVEAIWDQIAANEGEIPVPESHKAELDRRRELYRKSPDDVLTVEQLKERIENQK